HITLPFETGFEIIASPVVGNHICFFDFLRQLITKNFIEHFIRNERFAETMFIKPNSVFTKLYVVHRYTGHKMSHHTLYCMSRYTPNPEESKYMIDSESIEIVTHLFETLLPPGKAIFLHAFPVICGEFPVLSNGSEIIRWCTGLFFH